ncbi:MAG: universal stress protein [Flavobacteriales bacterium]|nr:universal stress protein [Flavobacteriales bacterium]MBK6945963.1 universal stress protein [Flavobacteriales bacterium]MBK7239099.1 universal stress protein [Flavobacteriales bacterium]MBK7296719.1 universal stress protein [Flavobacteriales bacterium]MBK9536796.1 universal stress protein [Flavobacteriales bacterium]
MSLQDHPGFKQVLHLTSFRPEEIPAFHAALRLALDHRGKLTLLHIGMEDHDHVPWDRFPHVRETLEGWGLMPKDSAQQDVFTTLGIKIHKHALHAKDLKEPVARYLDENPSDMVVMATEGRSALRQLVSPSRSEPIADLSNIPTLFLPTDGPTPLRETDGALSLKRILIPALNVATALTAIRPVLALARCSVAQPVIVHIMHVGDDAHALDALQLPNIPEATWERSVLRGAVVETISEFAASWGPDLIAMATDGRDSWSDALMGTTTERILRGTKRMMLAVPGK